jgi:3-hydroxyisobutyrate dehydrogenase/2-hydroxy-3-oxopropionate reductase
VSDAATTTVGLVGTGRMGGSMARALASAGFALVVHNRTRQRAEALAAEVGASTVATPAEVAARADVTLTMLTDDAAVLAVYRGPDGLLAGVRPGGVLVDLSTVTPDTIRTLDPEAHAVGASLLDAPVSGSVALASAGALTLMVGGDPAVLERARPVLDALANAIFHLGPIGAGAAMKLAVNTVIFGLNGAVAEGLVLAEAAGVPRDRAYEVLATSAVGAPYLGYKRDAFLDPDGTPVAFALDLAAKDLGLIMALADRLGVPVPQARANLALIRDASSGGRGGRDFSTVAEQLRSAALETRAPRPTSEEAAPG